MPTTLPTLSTRPSWREAIAERTSRRSYLPTPLTADEASRLTDLCEELSTIHPTARAVFVNEPGEDIFTGIVGAYGVVIQHAPAFVAFVASGEYVDPDPTGATDLDRKPMYADVEIGRIGEAVVLEATTMGLGTCWVAGSFDRTKTSRHIELAAGEHVRAVTPIGHPAPREGAVQVAMQRLVRARSRKALDVIAPGSDLWPEWARSALDAVHVAPSGRNGQPWRVRLESGMLILAHATDEPLVPTYMADMGIALLHAEVAVAAAGIDGTWSIRKPDASGEVARFTPSVG